MYGFSAKSSVTTLNILRLLIKKMWLSEVRQNNVSDWLNIRIGDLSQPNTYYSTLNSRHKINGWTALHWAAKRNNVEAIKILMSNGAKCDIKNNEGKTPGMAIWVVKFPRKGCKSR